MRQSPPRRVVPNAESGFSFIEILMAITLVSLGFLTYGLTSGKVMSANTKSSKKTLATTLAQDKIEFIKNPAEFPDHMDDSGTEEHLNEEGEVNAGGPFTRQWSVSPVSATGRDKFLHGVSVSVSWVNNGPQSVTLSTLVPE